MKESLFKEYSGKRIGGFSKNWMAHRKAEYVSFMASVASPLGNLPMLYRQFKKSLENHEGYFFCPGLETKKL
jgi:hypothetical protein